MSSLHDWREQVIAEHDATRPFAPENGQPLKFAPGDRIVYTNDYGAQFTFTVTGLYQPEQPCSLYATGRRYLVDSDSPWFPVKEAQLSKASEVPSAKTALEELTELMGGTEPNRQLQARAEAVARKHNIDPTVLRSEFFDQFDVSRCREID